MHIGHLSLSLSLLSLYLSIENIVMHQAVLLNTSISLFFILYFLALSPNMSAHNLISKNIIILFSATCREKVSEQRQLCPCVVCVCVCVGVGVGESEY